MKMENKIKYLIIILCLFASVFYCAAEPSPVKFNEIVVLKAQIKLLKSKIKSQAATIEKLKKQIKNATTQPAISKTLTTKPANVQPKPIPIQKIMGYALAQSKIAGNTQTLAAAEKIKLESKAKIKDMLLKGPFILTLRVIGGKAATGHSDVNGIHEIRFGLPLELAKTLRGLKDKTIIAHQPLLNIHAYGKSYRFRLNSQQKKNFRKGSLIFLKGNIAFGHAWTVGHGSVLYNT